MGVMRCDRAECSAILCNRLVLGKYLCEDCWRELHSYKDEWAQTISPKDLKSKLQEFIDTPKVYEGSFEDAWDQLVIAGKNYDE